MAEVHMSEGMQSAADSQEAVWCVTLPSEAVLLFDCLHDFMNSFGKVITVTDIDESIQVQYDEKDPADKLQQALAEM